MRNRSPGRRRQADSGFTLIELMIAMAVMLIGLLALWGLHAAAISSNANAYRLGISTILAQDALEQLASETYIVNFTSLAVDPGACGGAGFPLPTEDGLEPLPCSVDSNDASARVNALANFDATQGPVMYLRTHHVQTVANSIRPRILIRVRVTYQDPHTGKRHGVTMGTTRSIDTYDPMDQG
jgi:prepilin-type N-terminal cleavage/methylation domain-containing protein